MKKLMLSGLMINVMVNCGCSVAGKWTLISVTPEAARREVEFSSLTLQKDGSFYAEALQGTSPDLVVIDKDKAVVSRTDDAGIHTTSGVYEYKNETLALRSHDGEVFAYDARITAANQLQLEKFYGAQRVTCKFKRVE